MGASRPPKHTYASPIKQENATLRAPPAGESTCCAASEETWVARARSEQEGKNGFSRRS